MIYSGKLETLWSAHFDGVHLCWGALTSVFSVRARWMMNEWVGDGRMDGWAMGDGWTEDGLIHGRRVDGVWVDG